MGNLFSKKGLGALIFVGSSMWIFYIDFASFLFKAVAAKQDASSLTVTNIFIKLIIGLFILGLIQLVFRYEKLSTFSGTIPNHLTALGVLGTFVGIFLGLYKFDVGNLKQSVPLLLDGMKLAFSTSVAGLATSTALRVTHSIIISIIDLPDPFQPPQPETI